MTNRQDIRIATNWLDGWSGQTDRLRDEFEKRLQAGPGVTAAEMRRNADFYRPHEHFSAFGKWLNGEAERLRSGAVEKAALLVLANEALASWPDEMRRAHHEWFMLTEVNGSYEYGGPQTGSDLSYHGFLKNKASWLLPLSRAAHFDEAESIFPDVASVQECAATFHDVPLTAIEFTGGMVDDVFDAFLAWAATKPLKALTACNYSVDRGSLSNPTDSLKAKLVDFKQRRRLT